ncbi:MAG: hypothetical protein AAGC96_13710 [Pseudomonadota bacterium]
MALDNEEMRFWATLRFRIAVKLGIHATRGLHLRSDFFAPDPRRVQLEMVVDRTDGYIEVYFATPATTLAGLFDLSPQALAGSDGTVNFDSLRLGTANIGDELFARVESRIGNTETQFEAMSVMVHPIGDEMPFYTALDGIIAISVCTVDNPPQPPTLAQLRAYSGFIAVTDEHSGTLSMKMPNPEGTSWRVSVRDHTDGTLERIYVTTISPEGELMLPGGSDISMFDRIFDWAKVLVASGNTNV